jgi:tetratricopeptide (TPR) repeat protein
MFSIRRSRFVAAVVFICASIAGPALADELSEINALIIENPADVELNLQYALVAEGQGKYRLALAAYERILLNDPDNRAAKRGLVRVRRLIQPPTTRTFIEAGVKGESNAEHQPDPGQFDFLGFGRLRVRDERNLGETRWRSEGTLYGEIHSESDSLNYASAYGTLGPIFDLGATLISLHPAVGGGVAMLDGQFYYVDVNASATFEGYLEGA